MNSEQKANYIKLLQQTPQIPFEASCSHISIFCVLDTNVLMDLWVFKDRKVSPIAKALEDGSIQLIGHAETFCELADVLSRKMFNLSDDEHKNILNLWIKNSQIINAPLPEERFCRDGDDDKFFALARLSQAMYLVSKDKKVLKARGKAKKFGTQVVKVEEFCSILVQNQRK